MSRCGYFLLALVASSCGDDGDRPPGDGGAQPPDGGGEPAKLTFSPCPFLTEPGVGPPSGPIEVDDPGTNVSPIRELLAQSGALPGLNAAQAECATARLPAKWSEPSGDSMEIFVKRYPARTQPAKGQLWLLSGGPGMPGSTFEGIAFLIASDIPTLDIYLPDHRGTGKSTLAPCDSLAQVQSCAAQTPHLDGLTLTGAARDLAWLIDASHDDAQPVFVYGASYGTAWAQRYMQVRPEQPDAVILDSTVHSAIDLTDSYRAHDAVARRVLERCRTDATCAAKLGDDPVATAEAAIAAVKAGTCVLPAGTRPALPRFFGDLVSSSTLDLPLLPASVYRVLRCNEADRAWFSAVSAYLGWRGGLPAGNSDVVWLNIGLSEFWNDEITYEARKAEEDKLLAVLNTAWTARQAETWPTYPRDEYSDAWPTPERPLLVLQGGLDPLTDNGAVVKQRYAGDDRYFVELPESGHAVIWPTTSPRTDLAAPGCGWQIVRSFLEDVGQAPDTACIAEVPPPTFANPNPDWLAVVGISDLWENP